MFLQVCLTSMILTTPQSLHPQSKRATTPYEESPPPTHPSGYFPPRNVPHTTPTGLLPCIRTTPTGLLPRIRTTQLTPDRHPPFGSPDVHSTQPAAKVSHLATTNTTTTQHNNTTNYYPLGVHPQPEIKTNHLQKNKNKKKQKGKIAKWWWRL